MSNDFTQRADLEVIRYAQVWEDHQILEDALAVAPQDDVLSISSAGCNALGLLLRGARSVTALDVSGAQLAVLALKQAAIQTVSYDDFLVLLGATPPSVGPPQHPAGDPLAVYAALRDALPEGTRAFWDARQADLAHGLAHGGRLERYFRGFQDEILHRSHKDGAARAQRLLSFDDPAAQLAYFDQEIATPDFCAAFRAYFGQQSLQSRGRDPAQFRYVTADDIGAEFLRRLRALIARMPLGRSPYMRYFFTSQLQPGGQPYLSPQGFAALRDLLPRLQLVQADLGAYLREQPEGRFNKANLSDIFEYMDDGDAAGLLQLLSERLRPGGRIAYWNLLVPRGSSPQHSRLRALPDEAARLHSQDRIFFYQDLHIEEVLAP